MRCMPMYKPYKLLSFIILFLVTIGLNAQSIDPTKQINWSTGQPIPNLSTVFVNNVVMADQYSGADACAKLHNAMLYAIGANIPAVNATGFVGSQGCASNPFLNLTSGTALIGTSVNLTVWFGSTTFVTAVPWVIVNSGISLRGAGSMSTRIDLHASSTQAGIVMFNTDSGSSAFAMQGGTNATQISDILVYSDNGTATDGWVIEASRSKFDNIHAWGVLGCGIDVKGSDITTYVHPVVSTTDAFFAGLSGMQQPVNGMCFDLNTTSTFASTASTITDPVMEGVSGTGINIIKGNNLVFTGGTSESNGAHGIFVNTGTGVVNKQNTFIGIDLEGNGADLSADGYDVLDNGQNNIYINILATSHCNASCHSVLLTGGGSQYVLGGQIGDLVNNAGMTGGGASGIVPIGFSVSSATGGSATALPAQPSGYVVQELNGNIIKIPYYN